MLVTGFASFLILYGLAPVIANRFMDGGDLINSVDDVTYVIRMVSFALIIVPVMSLIRGFFQGHQSMGPTTVSQIIEQIVRILFLLSGAYIVIKVMDGNVKEAVGLATLAAFVGAVAGLIVLIWYWVKRKKHFDHMLTESAPSTHVIHLKDLYRELFIYAIPFVLVGVAYSIYQTVDLYTFNPTMKLIGQGGEAEHQIGIFTMTAQKLVMIPVSLATAMGLTLVPAITTSFTSGDKKSLKSQITKTFEILLFLTIPAVIGLSLMAKEAYTVLYSYDPTGILILAWYAPAALAFSLFSVTIAILQGLNLQKYAMYSLGAGLLFKIGLNIPLIKVLEGRGAVMATAIGFFVSVLFNCFIIRKYANYSFRRIKRCFIRIILFTTIMGISVWAMRMMLESFSSGEYGKLHALVHLIIGVLLGAGVYGYLSVASGLASSVLGSRFKFLQRKRKAS